MRSENHRKLTPGEIETGSWIPNRPMTLQDWIFNGLLIGLVIAGLVWVLQVDKPNYHSEKYNSEKYDSSIHLTDSLIQCVQERRSEVNGILLDLLSIPRTEKNSKSWDRADSSCNALLDSDYKLLVQLQSDKRWLEWKKQILLESNKGGGE